MLIFVFYFSCSDKWFGAACEKPCVNGHMNPVGSQNCACDPGWAGLNCDAECSLHGIIQNGKCVCDIGWRGPLCDIPGCPGDGVDCTGHGDCNTGTHICTCYNGWTGQSDSKGYVDPLLNGCNVPDCPGSPDCNSQGTCSTSFTTPRCIDCNPGWMGPACEDICDKDHGHQNPPNSGQCECDSCYTGKGCNSECDEHGDCVNGACQCHESWRGSKCEVAGCPGVEKDCSGHGVCDSTSHRCSCLPGFHLLHLF